MEQRSLTGAERASENLVQTYLRLGRAVPGAEATEGEAFALCRGPFDHSLCNFAARLRLDPWSARELRRLASERKSFTVYRLPTDAPEHAAELLDRAGFRMSYRLVQMVAEDPEPGPSVATKPYVDAGEREALTAFMTAQFFSRRADEIRRALAQATAHAESLELRGVVERSRPIAAAMISHTEGAVGVYNLCVAATRRGRGIGRGLVASILETARERDCLATLQCDARLEHWYGCQGFRSIGYLEVYALDKSEVDVII